MLLGNPRLLRSHALDYQGVRKSILCSFNLLQWKTWYLKTTKYHKNIYLEKNVIYLHSGCFRINSNWFRILQSRSRSHKHSHFSPDDSSLSLGTKMGEISRLETRVSSLGTKRRGRKIEALTRKEVFIGFLLGLSSSRPLQAQVT